MKQQSLKWILGLAASLFLILVVLHGSAAKSLLRSALTDWAASELGGEVELQELDYRLWRGELILRGLRVVPATESPPLTFDAREIAVVWSPSKGASVSVKSPRLKLLQAAGTRQAVSIPAGLAALTMEDGTLLVSKPGQEPWLEITSITLDLIARQGGYEGSVHSPSGRVERLFFSNLRSSFVIHGNELEITEALVEEGQSRVQARGKFTSLSPLEAELDLDFHLDAGNVQTLAPELDLTGAIEGNARAVVNSSGLHLSSEIRSPALKSPLFGQWAVDGEIAIENTLLVVHRVALRGYGGVVEAKGRLDLDGPSHSLEVSFAGMEIPALSRIWAKRSLPIASRADGFMKLELTDWSLNGADGSGRVSFSHSPTEEGVPLTGAIDFSAASGEIRFETQQLAVPDGSLEVDGSLRGDRSLTATYAARFEEFRRLDPILQFLEIPVPPPELRGGISLQGDLSGDHFQLSSLTSNITFSSDSLVFYE